MLVNVLYANQNKLMSFNLYFDFKVFAEYQPSGLSEPSDQR